MAKNDSDKKNSVIGVIGLGYVGLPLALQFIRTGNRVLGFDVDPKKEKALNAGQSYIEHISADEVAFARKKKVFEATIDFNRIQEVSAILICVPTPLTRHREPNLDYIRSTAEQIGPQLQKGQLVVLESTTYPGTTHEVLQPILEKHSGLAAGKDFHLAYSPEREDPGNPTHKTADIPKVVGGLTPECLKVAQELYQRGGISTVAVSSTSAAEATKLMENIFRSVNIAMVNELKIVFERMGIDIWEVIEAAKSKPFGYMPFYPGPGLGGHCIPIDPFYLTWKAREFGIATRFIELAGEINTGMPRYVIERIQKALNEHGKPLKEAKILLLGLAYKKNVDDVRESPSFVLWELLEERGAKVVYHDPHVSIIPKTREHAQFAGLKSVELTPEALGNCDAVLIATDHAKVDYRQVAQFAPLVIDTRNACGRLGGKLEQGNIVKA